MSAPSAQIGGCLDCGGNLRTSDDALCPQCGRAFDRNDPASFESNSACLMRRRRAGVVRCAVLLATVVLFGAILWYARFPGFIRNSSWIYLCAWPMLGGMWSISFLVQLYAKHRQRQGWRTRRMNPLPAIMLGAITLLALMIATDAIYDASMSWSRPAILDLATRMRGQCNARNNYQCNSPQWAGFYRFKGAMALGNLGDALLWSDEFDGTMIVKEHPNYDEQWKGGKTVFVTDASN